MGSIIGIGKDEIEERIPELVEFAELEDWIDEPLKTYSSGMNARLGMAGIAYFRPDILLIDEVLGVGDPTFKEKSREKIMEMVNEAIEVMTDYFHTAYYNDINVGKWNKEYVLKEAA